MHSHDGQNIDARFTQLAEDLRDTSFSFFFLLGPAGDFYDDLIAGARRCVYRITPVADPAPKMRDTAG